MNFKIKIYQNNQKIVHSSIRMALATLHSEFSKRLAQQLQCLRPMKKERTLDGD
jgi:hypothetical protein